MGKGGRGKERGGRGKGRKRGGEGGRREGGGKRGEEEERVESLLPSCFTGQSSLARPSLLLTKSFGWM